MRKLQAVAPESLQLIRDLKANARTMSRESARSLVRTYYQLQDVRMMQSNRSGALARAGQSGEHLEALTGLLEEFEKEVSYWLDAYSTSSPVGMWARGQYGLGPVLTAGFMAALDITKAPHVSSFWSYCGLDPAQHRVKGERCPYDPEMKTLAWKLGESFMKVSGNEKAYYGQLYLARKRMEWGKNLRGEYTQPGFDERRGYNYGPDTESYKWTSGQYAGVKDHLSGDYTPLPAGDSPGIRMLPPQAIHARAKRYAVKRFLSHFWQKTFEHTYPGVAAPHPWVLEYGGHTHMIDPPPVAKKEFA